MGHFKQGLNSNGEVLNDFYEIHDACKFYCEDDGLTRQEFADECNINVLMARYESTGVLPANNMGTPQYLDVSEIPDLAKAFEVLKNAESAFMTLPATVRREFDNDAIKFADFASDPENISQMREWKLAPPLPEPTLNPQPASPIAAPPPSPTPLAAKT